MNIGTDTVETLDQILAQVEKIMRAIAEDEAITALSETDLLLKMLDNNYKKEHKLDKLQKSINHFLLSPQNTRLLRLQQRLKREIDTAIEYYDEDVGNDNRLFYQKELEDDIIKLYADIRTALGLIIRTKLSGEISL